MALRRSLAQLAQLSSRQSTAPYSAVIDIGATMLRTGPQLLPSVLHRPAASFTSLRVFEARLEGAGSPAVRTQMHGSRYYTSTSSPDQQGAAGAAAAQTLGGTVGGETLEEIRARIFGTHIGNGLRSGRKVLRKQLLGDKIEAYYPEDPRAKDPLMLSLKAEKAKAKLDRMRRRGKAPPKKGAGKRAKK